MSLTENYTFYSFTILEKKYILSISFVAMLEIKLTYSYRRFISAFVKFVPLFSTEESYTVRLPINVLNTVKEGESGRPFTKIGFMEFPSDATLSDLRESLKKEFPYLLQGKVFLFQDAMMADVDPTSEGTTKCMYSLSVIIRFANQQGNYGSGRNLISLYNIIHCMAGSW